MLNEDNNSQKIKKNLKHDIERNKIYIDILYRISINTFPIRNFAGNIVIKLSFAR